MIDTMGYGIYQMNKNQAETYHLLPDYDLSDSSKTIMTLYAFEPNYEYTKKIVNNKNLSFDEIVKLDAEQKANLSKTTVGNSKARVWKDVPQNVPQNVPQKNSKLPANFDTVVIDLIKQNNKITREEIAAKYNVDTKTITRRLKKLNVVFIGGINGHWEIQ